MLSVRTGSKQTVSFHPKDHQRCHQHCGQDHGKRDAHHALCAAVLQLLGFGDLLDSADDHVNAPQVEIDSITDNLNIAEDEIDRGVQQIAEAQELQDGCTKSMMCITLSMVLSTMLMAALMVFWMKRHGLL
jgi:hypothetical protein